MHLAVLLIALDLAVFEKVRRREVLRRREPRERLALFPLFFACDPAHNAASSPR